MEKICQSCGMPITNIEEFGTEENGDLNQEYCKYCYQDGKFFGGDCTMEQMIEFCILHLDQYNPDITEQSARKMMQELFPKLKRWAK